MMNQQLTTELAGQVAEPGHPPPRFLWPEWLRRLANDVVSEGGLKTRLDSDLAPTDWQRKIMEKQIGVLDAALTPAHRHRPARRPCATTSPPRHSPAVRLGLHRT